MKRGKSLVRSLGFILFILVLFLPTGCGVRSISDSGYEREGHRKHSSNPFYKGELTELEVLGIDPYSKITNSEIEKSLATAKKVRLKKNASILLIQSGALLPDRQMVKELGKYFTLTPFTGVPVGKDSHPPTHYDRALRLVAARGGCGIIICYWGTLETARENLATKTISWVPIVGGVIPDKRQKMRIRLKFAILEVKTGSWSLFAPEPISDTAISASSGRQSSDQRQVALLKKDGYKRAIKELIQKYQE